MSTEQILHDLEKASDKESKTIYLPKYVVAETEKALNGLPISHLIERLLRDFLSGVKGAAK